MNIFSYFIYVIFFLLLMDPCGKYRDLQGWGTNALQSKDRE
jgi:hypothetical protein